MPAIDRIMTGDAQAPGAGPPATDPSVEPSTLHASAFTEAVSHELQQHFDRQLPDQVVRDHVTRAAADLRGSISGEALPEMVFRLAAVRLERHLWPDPSPAPSP